MLYAHVGIWLCVHVYWDGDGLTVSVDNEISSRLNHALIKLWKITWERCVFWS